MTRCFEVATGAVSNRNQIIDVENLGSYIFPSEQKTETYHSWYQFDDGLRSHVENGGSVSHFSGMHYVNNIILDYDNKRDGDVIPDKDLYQAIHWLVNTDMIDDLGIQKEHIRIWYSGTGFHIEMPNLFGFKPSVNLPTTVKKTLVGIFPDCDDIYDGARLIRAPFSFNKKLGNFKIPFTVDAFNECDISAILRCSFEGFEPIELQGVANTNVQWSKVTPYLQDLIKEQAEIQLTPKQEVKSKFRIDPNSKVTCMQSVLGQDPPVGERNITMMRLASWMRRLGMPVAVVKHTLATWSGLYDEAVEVSEKIFAEGYEYGCADTVMSKHCKPECIYFKYKDYTMNLQSSEDLAEKYYEFMQKDFTRNSINFKDIYPTVVKDDYYILPGELVVVTGTTGMGKSTYVMNLVANLPHLKTMFLSLENTWHLMFRRFIQMTHGMSKIQAMKAFMDNEKRNKLHESFKHIQITCDSPELSRLIDSIATSKPQVVVVDTSDCIIVSNSRGEIDKMNTIIEGLSQVAKKTDVIIIIVHHQNKEATNANNAGIGGLKGTTNVPQKADKVLVINGEMNGVLRHVKTDKARDEGFMQVMLDFNKNSMMFCNPRKYEGPPT
jgi:hypothetical protein